METFKATSNTASDFVPATRLPRGVADLARHMGYVANFHGGIDALDLSSGDLQWRSTGATHLLHVYQHQPVGQRADFENAHGLRVVMLNPEELGAESFTSELIHLPDWVYTRGTNTTAIATTAYLRQNDLYLVWASQKGYEGGANAPQAMIEKATFADAGMVRVNLESGQVTTVDRDQIPGIRAQTTNTPSEPYYQDGQWRETAWRVDGAEATLLRAGDTKSGILQLQCVDTATGARRHLTEVARGRELQPLLTLDGRYLLVSSAETTGMWRVFDVLSGETLDPQPARADTQSIALLDDQLYLLVIASERYTERRTLVCQEVATGNLLWEHLLDADAHVARSLPPALPQ